MTTRRVIIWVTTAVLLVVQGAVAAFIVWSGRHAQQKNSSPVEILRRARVMAEDGARLEALALLEKAKEDPSVAARVEELQRSIRATPKLLQARRLIERGEWAPAKYHLEQVLRLIPSHAEALALMAEARRHQLDASPSKYPAVTVIKPAEVKQLETPVARPERRLRRKRIKRPKKPATQNMGRLFAVSTPRALLYIDGTLRGSTPQDRISLSEGKHQVEIKLSGMKPYVNTINIVAGKSHALNVKLRPVAVAKPPKSPSKPTPAKVAPKPAVTRRAIPRLRLPAKVRVALFKDGKQAKVVRVVCIATERMVTKAMGRSASGTTRALLQHLYANASPADDPQVTLYPRTMGYLIAQAMNNNRRGIGSLLVQYHRSGKLAQLAGANWKP